MAKINVAEYKYIKYKYISVASWASYKDFN